jgi:hypothetical protein
LKLPRQVPPVQALARPARRVQPMPLQTRLLMGQPVPVLRVRRVQPLQLLPLLLMGQPVPLQPVRRALPLLPRRKLRQSTW